MIHEEREEIVRRYSDGNRSRLEVAALCGLSLRMIVNVLRNYPDIPRMVSGAPRGARNPSWVGGRLIERCGRVLIPAPRNHPHARVYGNKKIGRILEHRLEMEKHLNRFLLPKETVDHIDGCVLHNHISNLRLFSSNGEHLKSTITGLKKDISSLGKKKLRSTHSQREGMKRVDRYLEMKKVGDYRLLQILHAHALLDKDSPYLLGTHRYLAERQIDFSCAKTIKQNLVELCHKWELHQKLLKLKHLL